MTFDLAGRVDEAFRREVLGVWPSLPSAPEPGSPPPQVGEVRSYHNPGVDITRMLVRSQTEDRLRREAGLPPAGDTLAALDAAVEGRCAGPGCSAILTERSASAYFCSQGCQESWNRRQANRPDQVRGSLDVDPSEMRWRPDLVTAFDDAGLELVDELRERDRTRRWYRHTDGRRFLRLDDGHRWVGGYADPGDGLQLELWRRLERELGDQRRLAPSPPAGPQPHVPVFWIGEQVYYERDRDALVGWLRANGLDSDFVRQGQEAAIRDGALTVESYVTGPDGQVLFDELLGGPRVRRVTVPLVQPPPEPRSDLLRRGEAFERAVLEGTVFWLPNPPADPEAPTMAELEGGIDLMPYLAPAVEYATDAIQAYQNLPGETRTALDHLMDASVHATAGIAASVPPPPSGEDIVANVRALSEQLANHNPAVRFNAGTAVIGALRSQAPRSRPPGGQVGGLLGVPVVPDGSLAPDSWRLEYADGQRFESHVCQWEATAWRGALSVEYRCRLRWSDGAACDSVTAFPADLRRTERLVSGLSATGGAS